ncbi:hypothetical protein NDU88_002978 [Pleurodeles waltl]|uniref:Uncharacterized protein n=1 Tax=Pleurodeles waltl TaxID=8319 RepID=A0AAV7M5S3_PLEWA|nr:hypothetical protein NDU88_002978 [Pleurodeles waltl]
MGMAPKQVRSAAGKQHNGMEWTGPSGDLKMVQDRRSQQFQEATKEGKAGTRWVQGGRCGLRREHVNNNIPKYSTNKRRG